MLAASGAAATPDAAAAVQIAKQRLPTTAFVPCRMRIHVPMVTTLRFSLLDVRVLDVPPALRRVGPLEFVEGLLGDRGVGDALPFSSL